MSFEKRFNLKKLKLIGTGFYLIVILSKTIIIVIIQYGLGPKERVFLCMTRQMMLGVHMAAPQSDRLNPKYTLQNITRNRFGKLFL